MLYDYRDRRHAKDGREQHTPRRDAEIGRHEDNGGHGADDDIVRDERHDCHDGEHYEREFPVERDGHAKV